MIIIFLFGNYCILIKHGRFLGQAQDGQGDVVRSGHRDDLHLLGDARMACGDGGVELDRADGQDAHTCELMLPSTVSDQHIAFFAVFDGHGGPRVSKEW